MKPKLVELIRQAKKEMRKESLSCDLEREFFIAEYLTENGVIVPPCKVGDTVYVVCRSHFSERAAIREEIVTGLKYHNGYWYIDTQEHSNFEYGENVFINYADAEKALKERDLNA